MRSTALILSLGFSLGLFIGCDKGSDTTVEERLCQRLDECNALLGWNVADCADETAQCTDQLITSEKADWDKFANDCLEFSSCSLFTDCYATISFCTVIDDTGGSGSSGGEGEGSGGSSTTGGGSGESSTTGGSGTSSSSGGPAPEEDPNYPRSQGGVCPGNTAALTGTMACGAACVDGSCPAPASGSAQGMCVFNPDSSATACTSADGCVPPETCTPNAGGSMSCLLEPSNCVLFCSVSGQNCPDSMTCATLSGDQGVCDYAP